MFTTTKFNYSNYKLSAIIVSIIAFITLFLSFYLGKTELFLLLNANLGKAGDFILTYGTHAGDGLLWLVWLAAIFYTRRKHLFPLIISAFILSTVFTQIGKLVILPDAMRPAEALKIEILHLQKEDALKTINGAPVITLHDMFQQLNKVKKGENVEATYYRNGKLITSNFIMKDEIYLHIIKGVDVHSFGSFPSGHTATAFTFALLIGLLIQSTGLSLLCIFAALLISYTRIYLSQHFPLDVAAGMIVAVLSVSLSLLIQKWFDKKRYLKHHKER